MGNVRIDLMSTLGLDTTQAKAALGELQREVKNMTAVPPGAEEAIRRSRENMATPAGVSPAMSPRQRELAGEQAARQTLRDMIGLAGSYEKAQEKIAAHLAQQQDRLKAIRAEQDRIRSQANASGNLDLLTSPHFKELSGREREQAAHVEHLRAGVTDLEHEARAAESRLKSMGRSIREFLTGSTTGLTLGQALKGGGLMAGAAAIGSAAMTNPLISIPAVVGGSALLLKHLADQFSEYSERIDIQFADLARRTGTSRNLREVFEPHPGMVDDRFLRAGYAGEDAVRIATAYGMPAPPNTLVEASLAHGQFARAFGFGQQPEAIAGIGRHMTELGVAEPGEQAKFWSQMATAVNLGVEQGVDASGQLRALVGLTEKQGEARGVLGIRDVAGLAGLMAALGEGESRFFKGERGAEKASTLLESMQNPKGIAQERYLMNVIAGVTKGRPLTAEELDLTGHRADIYNKFNELTKNEYILQQYPKLLESQHPRTREVARKLLQSTAQAGGPGLESLSLQAFTGMNASQLLEAENAIRESAVGTKGRQITTSDALGIVADKAGKHALDVLKGQALPTEATKIEQTGAYSRQIDEQASRIISDASGTFRTSVQTFEGSVLRFASLFTSTPTPPGTDLPSRTDRAADAVGQWFNRLFGGEQADRLTMPPDRPTKSDREKAVELRQRMSGGDKAPLPPAANRDLFTNPQSEASRRELASPSPAAPDPAAAQRVPQDAIIPSSPRPVPEGDVAGFRRRVMPDVSERTAEDVDRDTQATQREMQRRIERINETIDAIPRESPYLGQKMSLQGNGTRNLTVTLGGSATIELVGAGIPEGTTIPTTALSAVVERMVREGFEGEARMAPTRSSLIDPLP